ncbi:MAG: phosphodiesterase [Acholeplasmataceae bacterium]|nr:phosphodiesterase [Acholeplasmataceae bacterium]
MRYLITSAVQINDTWQVILSFIGLLIMLVVTYALIRFFFKERRRQIEEKEIMMDGVLSKSAMGSLIASYVARFGKDTLFTLMYVDIDGFSEYITAFGDKEAERLLERVSQNMKNAIPKTVRIARYFGDEFVIFAGSEFSRSEATDIATRLKAAVAEPIKLFGDTEIHMTASIGIAFHPIHGDTYKELIESLKIVIYAIKKTGGNNIRIYSEQMDQQEGEYVEYYYQIKNAIHRKEFQLYYHPMIDVKNHKIYGFETLIRWNHPEFGILSPFKFLNIMEQSGDIHWIGLWGLETLIKTQQMIEQDFPSETIRFSMNLSPKQLMSDSLALDFQKMIKKYKASPEMIILEVVEFALFERQETIFKNIRRLKEIGFNIAIDGFGLDMQVLEKASDMEIDIIKLDNAFLKEEESYMKARFAEILIDFAERNKYTVIAEVIEDERMKNEAIKYRVMIQQGYYFTKPLAIEALKNYMIEASYTQK